MTSGDTASARAQLHALVAQPRLRAADALRDLPAADADARPAAVLMLFGVLDSVPSDRDAREGSVSRDLDVLLLERATTLRSHAGQVAFPGGRIDPGDDGPVAAALREAQEETGLDPSGVEVLGPLDPIPLARSGHLVTPVLGWWERRSPVGVVDVAESASVFGTPVADLLNPANRYTAVIDRGVRTPVGPAFLVRVDDADHLVWGFTAFLLDGLFDELGWTEPWDRTRTIDVL